VFSPDLVGLKPLAAADLGGQTELDHRLLTELANPSPLIAALFFYEGNPSVAEHAQQLAEMCDVIEEVSTTPKNLGRSYLQASTDLDGDLALEFSAGSMAHLTQLADQGDLRAIISELDMAIAASPDGRTVVQDLAKGYWQGNGAFRTGNDLLGKGRPRMSQISLWRMLCTVLPPAHPSAMWSCMSVVMLFEVLSSSQ